MYGTQLFSTYSLDWTMEESCLFLAELSFSVGLCSRIVWVVVWHVSGINQSPSSTEPRQALETRKRKCGVFLPSRFLTYQHDTTPIFHRGRGCSRPRHARSRKLQFSEDMTTLGKTNQPPGKYSKSIFRYHFRELNMRHSFPGYTITLYRYFLAMKSARYKESNLGNRTFRELRTIFYLHGFLAVAILLCKSKFQELLDLQPLCSAKLTK